LTIAALACKLKQMVEQARANLDDVFHALSDPTRRAIVAMLAERPHSVSELVPPFDMSLAAVSKHIKSLERAGLIDREVQGRTHMCSLNARGLSEAYRWLGGYERFWNERLDALEALLAERKGKRRGK
jgi:DNA-binding transcriptional ArsR family regulator